MLLVSNGGDIHAEISIGLTPLSLVTDPAAKAEMVFLTRRPLLLFFEAVAEDIDTSRPLRRVAGNSDLIRELILFCLK